MAAVEQTTTSFLNEQPGLEFSEPFARPVSVSHPEKLIVASYNIRYAVGRYLISSGVLRKLGVNAPLRRAQTVAANISIAAKAFSQDRFLHAPGLLALQQ